MTAAQLDQLLQKIAAYEYGQSRAPLAEMAEYLRSIISSPQALKKIEASFIELLRAPDTTPAGKQFICRKLSIIGTEKSVPVLAEMLTEKATSNFEPSDMARYALERILSPAADQALRGALSKTNGKIKIGIINSIGQRGSKESVKDLTALLDDSDSKVVTAAIWALGNIGSRKAANSLRRLGSITDPQMCTAWANAYLMCADKLLARGKARAALRIYRQLSSGEHNEGIQMAVLRGMVLSDPKQAPSIMLAGFLSPDERMQAAAVGVLREVRGSEIIKAITTRYAELPAAGRVRLLSVLGELGDKAALPAVESATASSDAEIRTAAFEALGGLGDASHVGMLAETAGRTGDPAQDAARQSLYRLSATKVDDRILELIPDSNPDAKVELIRAVGQRNIDEAAQTLLAAARSGPGQVRIESLKVLKDSAEPEHVQPLLQLLLDADDQTERRQAEVAVAAAAAKQKDTHRRADAVLAMLSSVTDVQAKSSLLSVLGKIGGAGALATLKESADPRTD